MHTLADVLVLASVAILVTSGVAMARGEVSKAGAYFWRGVSYAPYTLGMGIFMFIDTTWWWIEIDTAFTAIGVLMTAFNFHEWLTLRDNKKPTIGGPKSA
jgi:hypothetical protein